MSDWSNRDLDDLFRRGAERYDFEFNPEAWRRMQGLLRRDRRRRVLWWWLRGIGLLLVTGVILYFFFSGRGSPEMDGNLIPAAPVAPADRPDTSAASAPPSPAEQPDLSPETLRPYLPAAAADTPPVAGAGITDSLPAPARPARERRRPPARPSEGEAGPAVPAPSSAAGALARAAYPPFGADPEEADVRERAVRPPVGTLPPPVITLTAPGPAPDLKSLVMPPVPPEQPASRGWLFALNGAPEQSSVGPDNFGRTSLRAGLTAEYRFARHWSLGAGLHHVRKWYTAGEGEYTPPKGFWTRRIAPRETSGWCDVLEIPVFAGYYLKGHQTTTFFFEAGVSSLYMRREWYYYHYDSYDPDLIRYWEGRNAHHAWMSLLHLSPGFQVALSPSWRLQVAPYLQAPLAGVGHGKVALYSAGINARVGLFRPVRKK